MVRSYLIEDRICFDSDSGSGGVSAPRRTEIRGQDHMLAYITPEEGTILKAFGGSGDPGPMGIPAFYDDSDEEGGGFSDADADEGYGGASGGGGGGGGDGSAQAGETSTSDAETDDPDTAGAGSTEAGYSAGPDGQPGTADDTMGTPGGDLSRDGGYQGSVGPGFGGYVGGPDYAQKVAALEQLNKDLYDLSRREQRNKNLPGLLGYIANKNVRNLAEQLVAKDLNPDQMADRQSRGIRGETGKDPFGNSTTGIVGFTDEAGNVAYGRDPNEDTTSGGDGFDEFDDIRRRRRNSSGGDTEDTEDAPTVIDDFAVNYLRNPYFAYSGFGNQYNPYGYANSTLVDLLQTRGMTQPSQADTLGLFADPRDFR